MYTDIIEYRLADGVEKDQLFRAADDVLETWMKHQEGFVSWQINALGHDGRYMDIVQWRDEDCARAAEKRMMADLGISNPWFACYDLQSIKTKHLFEQKMYS